MRFSPTNVFAGHTRAIRHYFFAVVCILTLAGCAFTDGGSQMNAAQSIDTIEEAKAESLRIQRELVELSRGLRVAPQASQPAPIGERERTLLNCDSDNRYYQYPGVTSVAFTDADSVLEFHKRLYDHLSSSPDWNEDESSSENDDRITSAFTHRNGFSVSIEALTEPDNLREAIMVYSPCVELPHDFPRAGGPRY